jgi:mycothiol synthase
MTNPTLPTNYTARPATLDDAEEIAALIAACQQADGDPPDSATTAAEWRSDLAGTDLDEETVAVLAPDGRIAGYADLLNTRYARVIVYPYVHPAYLGRGVGAYLLGWGERWAEARMSQAPEGARVIVEQFAHVANRAAHALLEAHGYRDVRTHYWMDIDLHDAPPAPEWPAGVTAGTFVAGRDEAALYEAGEDSFQDMWERVPGTLERWTAGALREDFDSTLWIFARDAATGAIAAFSLCRSYDDRGVVDTFGVRRAWRRQGLGLALLRHTFGEFYRRGLHAAGLSVDGDSPTGAPRLYTRAGMRVTKSLTRYRKELRPGRVF